MVLVRRPRRRRALEFHQGLIQVEVALFVIFVEERRQYYLAMLEKQLLHRCTVVKQFFNDPQHLPPIFEMCGKQIDVDDDINQRDISLDLRGSLYHLVLKVWIGLVVKIESQLAVNNLL